MSATLVIHANEGFNPPGPIDFFLPDFFGHKWNESGFIPIATKPAVLLLLGAILTFLFLRLTSRDPKVVPTRAQYLGEQAYAFIRNGVGQDIIGPEYYKRWVPLLLSMFYFILINNLFGIVPLLSFPPFARASYAYGLAAMVWVIYNGIGIAAKGFVGYLKATCVPSGVPGWILPLLVPLEFFSNILVRPLTLSLRLFANMFAGHLLIILFSTGGFYLLLHGTGSIVVKPAGLLALAMGVAIGFLEFIVAILQAYVFTLLTATYIAGAVADEH